MEMDKIGLINSASDSLICRDLVCGLTVSVAVGVGRVRVLLDLVLLDLVLLVSGGALKRGGDHKGSKIFKIIY